MTIRPRTYVVTGSASGIGAATRAQLEREGARVIGVDLHGAEVLADLSARGGREDALRLIGEAAGEAVDALICCAGMASTGATPQTRARIDNTSPELILRVNYFGTVELVQALRSRLVSGMNPRVAVIASISLLRVGAREPAVVACLAGDEEAAVAALAGTGHQPDAATHAYRCSKRALAAWVRRVAPTADWAGAGIPVNAIAPGLIRTPILAGVLASDRLAGYLDSIPMPLNGPAPPEAAASLLVWLTSPANTAVTGQVIFVDGGADALTRGDAIWAGAPGP